MEAEEVLAQRRLQKRATVDAALKHGPVTVRFNAMGAGLELPQPFKGPPVLSFSPRFDPPDLVVDELGLRQTLSFDGVQAKCFVPWNLIWSIESKSDEGCGFFAESVPASQVQVFFNQLIEQRVLLDRFSRALGVAIALYDKGAGSGAWRRWREALRQALGGEQPKPTLELVKGGKEG